MEDYKPIYQVTIKGIPEPDVLDRTKERTQRELTGYHVMILCDPECECTKAEVLNPKGFWANFFNWIRRGKS